MSAVMVPTIIIQPVVDAISAPIEPALDAVTLAIEMSLEPIAAPV